jgi:cytochrome c biogenesis protein CcmG, thiol:disulfide interchange protein DsbE
MKQLISLILFFLVFLSNNGFAAVSSDEVANASINQAPDIDLPGLDGNIQLDRFKGNVIYLDFWASWCLPCKKSFPWMHDIKQAYADQGFEVVAVNLDKDRELADEFLRQMDVNFQVAFDESGQSASQYKLRGMPSSYLIGRDGKVYASHIGFRDNDKEKLEQAIKNLLSH